MLQTLLEGLSLAVHLLGRRPSTLSGHREGPIGEDQMKRIEAALGTLAFRCWRG